MSDVTKLLGAIQDGDTAAAGRLFPLIYEELNRLASFQMSGEHADRTLTATALVHEAYLRLVDGDGQLSFENRRHFFGAAARAMRQVLVDAARRRGRVKRGGDQRRVELPEVAAIEADDEILALDEALAQLAIHDPQTAQVVELHHFAGLPHEQVADLLGKSVYEVRQKWTFARAWLRDAMS
jgi:RNA polymerase sigma factor (TIGR02999 family)